MKVLILQTDNRDNVDYLALTKMANKLIAENMNTVLENTKEYEYTYEFRFMKESYYIPENIHPSTGKINIIKEIVDENVNDDNSEPYDVLVFLDSDAWIQNPEYIHFLIKKLMDNDKKNGCFSRDPYLLINSYINSGSFILKLNNYTKKMFEKIKNHLIEDPTYHNKWFFDQYYISDFIFKNKEDFYIFVPHILNTPYGHILRHCWWKSQKLFSDLYALLDIQRNTKQNYKRQMRIDYDAELDDKCFPNINNDCDEYLT